MCMYIYIYTWKISHVHPRLCTASEAFDVLRAVPGDLATWRDAKTGRNGGGQRGWEYPGFMAITLW